MIRLNPSASAVRPVLAGQQGAISAAHPLAAAAGQELLAAGGGAADAVIAAQAVLAVVAPNACGLGGDGFFLVSDDGQPPIAVNGGGASPRNADHAAQDGGASVTVPGLVAAWRSLSEGWGRLAFERTLMPAIRLARSSLRIDDSLAGAAWTQRQRLIRGGAGDWPLLHLSEGQGWTQPELAATLETLASRGCESFYSGKIAGAIVRAVGAKGGALSEADLAEHASEVLAPIHTSWREFDIYVQPPATQGVLLAVLLSNLAEHEPLSEDSVDHLGIELTQAAFGLRDRVAEGSELVRERLAVDPTRASHRGGPRSYLHTAGVAAADRHGTVIVSLASVFDDFGSCVFVPECGLTLNNRGGGFTGGANAFAPAKRPVHTLAPMLVSGRGIVAGIATPGADGQIQTLLQLLLAWTGGRDLAAAIHQARWRSEDSLLLIEAMHPARDRLDALGHRCTELPAGDVRFGAVTCAGFSDGRPFAVSDWRRHTWTGVT